MDKICFKTSKGPTAIGPYCSAVVYGDTVYMSGVIGVDPAVGKPVEGGTLAQAKQVFENIRTILGELNLTMDDVLKTTVFLKDLGDFAEVNKLYAEYFAPNFPARSCVEVSKLPMGLAIEVECIARYHK
ncbi:MAG: reactive intermediate/imine deaminase [Clostridia bacterium]|nr:reactive intermediate/imine deaminase [Clostridia bacterium]